LEEPEVVVGVASRGGSSTLLEAQLVDNTSSVRHFIPAVFQGAAAEVGPLKSASSERDELEVVGLDEERGAFCLGDNRQRVDQSSAVAGQGRSGRHVLAIADERLSALAFGRRGPALRRVTTSEGARGELLRRRGRVLRRRAKAVIGASERGSVDRMAANLDGRRLNDLGGRALVLRGDRCGLRSGAGTIIDRGTEGAGRAEEEDEGNERRAEELHRRRRLLSWDFQKREKRTKGENEGGRTGLEQALGETTQGKDLVP